MTTALLPASQVQNLFGTVDLRGVSRTDEACLEILELFGGAEAILETISHGRLMNEIALQLQIPIRWLNSWVQHNIDGTDLSACYTLGAETLMAKATMVLTIDVATSYEGAQARALADRFVKMAEQIDSQRWGTKRPDSLGGQTVNIQMNVGKGRTVSSKAAVVDAEEVEMPTITMVDMRSQNHVDLYCDEPDGGFL